MLSKKAPIKQNIQPEHIKAKLQLHAEHPEYNLNTQQNHPEQRRQQKH